MDDFEYLSDYYDQFVGADYQKIANYIDKKIKCAAIGGNYGVDLGCGSGTLTYLLSDTGYDMIGVDRSEGMLMRALEKKPAESKVLFLQQDLTQLDLYGAADFMVSTLDCLNYLEDEQLVKEFMSSCSRFLKPGGLLILDFNSLYKYRQVLDGQNFIYESDDAFCIWENEFDGRNMYYDLTYFVQKDTLYERREEHQMQTYYSLDFIINVVSSNGFEILSLEDDYDELPISDETQRIVLTAQKRSK